MLTIEARVTGRRRGLIPQRQLPVEHLLPGDRIARLRGLNVDQPRNLAKTVTVE